MLATDIHSHVMPEIDDGSRSPVETVAMARGLLALGVRSLYLTPHQFKLGNRLERADVEARTEAVRRGLAGAGVPLEVFAGAEHFYGEELLDAIGASDTGLIPLAVDGRPHLLVELPMQRPAVGVRRVGAALARKGFVPVLAHPERTRGLARELARADGWREAGWRFQLNLLSLVGRHGPEARDVAHALLGRGHYDFVGSDLHRPAELPWLREAHAAFRAATEEVRA